MSKVQAFLCNQGIDHRGRTAKQVLALDDQWWDDCHDFIQWLFPLPVASKFFQGDDCPVLTIDDLTDLWDNRAVQNNLIDFATRFCNFLGLEVFSTFDPDVTPDTLRFRVSLKKHQPKPFSQQAQYWLRAHDHNHLRINRMLQSLVLFGLDNLAREIFRCLVMIKCEFDDCIKDETMVYWRNALTGYSY